MGTIVKMKKLQFMKSAGVDERTNSVFYDAIESPRYFNNSCNARNNWFRLSYTSGRKRDGHF